MSDNLIVALLSLIGTFIGSFSGLKLTNYRLQQLEKKVDKHNTVIERTYVLENEVKNLKEMIQ